MAIQHDGKTPGKLWYGLQKTSAFVTAAVSKDLRFNLKRLGINTGLSTASIATGYIGGSLALSSIVFSPFVLPIYGASAVVGGFFAWKANSQYKTIKQSQKARDYMHRKEQAWLNKQNAQPTSKPTTPSFLRRASAFLAKTTSLLSYTASGVGILAAGAGGLQLAGVFALPVAVTTAVVGLTTLPFAVGALVGASVISGFVGLTTGRISKKLKAPQGNRFLQHKQTKTVAPKAEAQKKENPFLKKKNRTASFDTAAQPRKENRFFNKKDRTLPPEKTPVAEKKKTNHFLGK